MSGDDVRIVRDALRTPNLWSGSQMQFDALDRLEDRIAELEAALRVIADLDLTLPGSWVALVARDALTDQGIPGSGQIGC